MSSFCKGCDSWKRRKGSPTYKKWKILHVKECLKNHNGSAGMMETVGMVRIFQRSLSHRSVRYTSYIGDGDSKTFSSITASNPYGEDITVSKIECVGHVQKRMGTRLRKLKQMSSKLSDGKSIGGKGRLTDRMIDLITTYYGNVQSDKIKHACQICEKLFGLYISIYVQATKNHCTVFVP
ncbi:uncharacterized protein TNCV_4313511 [Trichonephila clavipes]|nr:uncharacterized protein TNCV_4313511 [Trichonephila clavipes]